MNRILGGVALILLISCSTAKEGKNEADARIHGRIAQSENGAVQLLDGNSFEVAFDQLNETSQFDFSVNLESGAYFQLKYNDILVPVYLSPDYDLELNIDTTDKESSIKFAGRGKESNEYMLAFGEFESSTKPTYDQLLAKSEQEFLIESRRYRSKSEAFLNNYQEHNFNLDPNFIAKERARILYAWANRLIHYPEAHLYYTGEDDFVVSDTYHDYKQTVNLDAPDLITLPEYQTFIRSYIDAEADILQKKGDKRNRDLIRFDLANQLISEEVVKDFACYSILSEALLHGSDPEQLALADQFLAICKNGEMRAEIKDLMDRWKALAGGQKSPSMVLKSSEGKFLKLSSFKGKFVYIRFWASWCQPCLNDTSSLQEVAEQTDKDNFVILSVNIDPKGQNFPDQVWSSTTSDLLQVKIPNDEIEEIKKSYIINSLPRYVLIDPDGRLVDAKAPTPSDPALLQLLSSYSIAAK